MCFVASVIQFAQDYMNVFFLRESSVLSSCQLNAYMHIYSSLQGRAMISWDPEKARRENPKNILSLESKLKKHMMFGLFYLKGNSFLGRALG